MDTIAIDKDAKAPCLCFGSIPILDFLRGQPWDDIAHSLVMAFKPRGIRVSTGMLTCDSVRGRVTVIVDDDNIINSISMEVAVPSDERMSFSELKIKYEKRGVIIDPYRMNDEGAKRRASSRDDVEVNFPPAIGWCYGSLPVLEFLQGQAWDDLAYGLVMSLNPDWIRVSTGALKCDSRIGRVTLITNELSMIKSIDFELEIPIHRDMNFDDLVAILHERGVEI